VASTSLSALVEVEVEASRTPPSPIELRKLTVKMANENPTWGEEERLTSELLLKLVFGSPFELSGVTCQSTKDHRARPRLSVG
jgi:hypothetical protein